MRSIGAQSGAAANYPAITGTPKRNGARVVEQACAEYCQRQVRRVLTNLQRRKLPTLTATEWCPFHRIGASHHESVFRSQHWPCAPPWVAAAPPQATPTRRCSAPMAAKSRWQLLQLPKCVPTTKKAAPATNPAKPPIAAASSASRATTCGAPRASKPAINTDRGAPASAIKSRPLRNSRRAADRPRLRAIASTRSSRSCWRRMANATPVTPKAPCSCGAFGDHQRKACAE